MVSLANFARLQKSMYSKQESRLCMEDILPVTHPHNHTIPQSHNHTITHNHTIKVSLENYARLKYLRCLKAYIQAGNLIGACKIFTQ